MKRFLVGFLVVAALIGVYVLEQDKSARINVLEASLRDAGARVSSWQAKYAEASVEQSVRVDTVRLYRTRYDTLRQTLNVHDTVAVIAYVTVADSLAQACSELATSCERLRNAADSTIASLLNERSASNFYIQGLQQENASLRKRKKLALLGVVGGVALGAWVRGQ